MVTRRKALAFSLVVLVAGGTLTAAVSGQSAPEFGRMVVVVSRTSSLTNLSFSDLRRLYKGEFVEDRDGNKLIPLALPPRSPERIAFDKIVIAMSPDQASNYWVDRKIRGLPSGPKSVESPELVQRLVNRLPASIGYVPDHRLQAEVKVVRIDGKLPTDPGYPVQ